MLAVACVLLGSAVTK